MLTLLEEIKGQTAHNAKLLNVLMNKVDSTQEMPDTNLPEDITLPMETLEIYEEIERKLEDQSFHKCMVIFFYNDI